MLNILLILILCVFVLCYWQWDKIRLWHWQKKYQNSQLNQQQRDFLARTFPVYFHMTDAERQQLEQHIVWFLGEKRVIGCDGLTVTEPMRLLIAAQACLLVLKKPLPLYPKVKEILLYPSAYYAPQTSKDSAGLVSFHRVIRQGESWVGGTLVLSWHDIKEGTRLPADGHNLVFHEFAHQLDQITGTTNGTPKLADPQAYKRWAKVFNRAYLQLKSHLAYNMAHVIHEYGATNEAEFFAVVTETFMEKPQQLRQFDAELFHLLVDYFEFDPTKWQR